MSFCLLILSMSYLAADFLNCMNKLLHGLRQSYGWSCVPVKHPKAHIQHVSDLRVNATPASSTYHSNRIQLASRFIRYEHVREIADWELIISTSDLVIDVNESLLG